MGTKVTIAPLGAVTNSSFLTELNTAITTLSNEFDKAVYRDGTFNLSGNLDMNSKRIYNLAAPTSPTDPLRLSDITAFQGAPATPPNWTFSTGTPGSGVVVTGTYPNQNIAVPRGDPGSSGSLPDGTYNDISVAGGGASMTIITKKITNSKLFNFDAYTLLGNNTGAATGPTYLSISDVKSMLSLNNVTNTTDASKPVSTAVQTALDLKAPLASPVFTGNPTVPTATPGDNDTSAANTAFVTAAVSTAVTAADVATKVLTIPVLAGSMMSRTSGGAASGSTETTTNKLNFRTFDFDAASDEFVQFSIPMPKGWNEGTVTAQFIWRTATGTAAQNVVWGIQGVALSDDDPIDAAFGTAVTLNDAVTATSDIMQSAFSSAVTIAGTPVAEDLVQFQVYRDADNGSDTMTGDAQLIAVRLKYTTNARDDA